MRFSNGLLQAKSKKLYGTRINKLQDEKNNRFTENMYEKAINSVKKIRYMQIKTDS